MYLLWAVAVLQLWVWPVPVACGGTVFVRPKIQVTTTFSRFDTRSMDHWGGGGGAWAKIPSNHPFKGRDFGGGKRGEIRGTRAFGSGYPYGLKNSSTVAGRAFPFGVWPLYWDQNFMDADEYGPLRDSIRPGGFIAIVPLRMTNQYFNVTDNEVYYAIGDRESLLPLMVSYVTWCHVSPAWPRRFDPKSSNAPIRLENVIQYFRGSSFALASPAYNNTHARTFNSDTKESMPLPATLEHSPFRKCVDGVSENALAIMSKAYQETALDRFTTAVIFANWVICGAMGITLFFICAMIYMLRVAFQNWFYGEVKPYDARSMREEELRYENYP